MGWLWRVWRYLLDLAFPNGAVADDREDDADGQGHDLGSEDSAFKNGEKTETVAV